MNKKLTLSDFESDEFYLHTEHEKDYYIDRSCIWCIDIICDVCKDNGNYCYKCNSTGRIHSYVLDWGNEISIDDEEKLTWRE